MGCCEDQLPDVHIAGLKIEVWKAHKQEGTAFVWKIEEGQRREGSVYHCIAITATAVKVTIAGDMNIYPAGVYIFEKIEAAIRQARHVHDQLRRDPDREMVIIDGAKVYPYQRDPPPDSNKVLA